MKKHVSTLLLAVVMGVLGFVVSGVAVAGVNDKPPSPPGQGECEHGNSAKPCKEDPSPNGKDCEAHGNNGGVNEDHCKGEETTPTDAPSHDTVPNEGASNSDTPPSTVPSEPSSTQATEGSPAFVGTPPVAAAPKKQAAALGVTADAPKPTRQAQQAPFTL